MPTRLSRWYIMPLDYLLISSKHTRVHREIFYSISNSYPFYRNLIGPRTIESRVFQEDL